MNRNIVSSSFIIISSFHSNTYTLDNIISNYLNEYETIYIFGNSINQEKKNIEIRSIKKLLDIKNLSDKYPGRVVYIPGNFDSYIYDYIVYGDNKVEFFLNANDNLNIIDDYNNFMRDLKNSNETTEVINWLGKLPLQKIHYYNGKKFVLSNNFFNQRLYKENPKLSLKDLYTIKISNPKEYEDLLKTIYFINNGSDFNYHPNDLPSSRDVMVIGHLPSKYRVNKTLDLENSNGEIVKIFCVENGFAYDGSIFKYNGNDKVCIPLNIDKQNIIPNYKEMDNIIEDKRFLDDIDKTQSLLKKIIIEVLKSNSDMDYCYDLLKHLFSTADDLYFFQDNETVRKTPSLNIKDINTVFKFYYYLKNSKIPNTISEDIYMNFIYETALEYIIQCLESKYNSKHSAAKQINQLFLEEDFSYITNSVGQARIIAKKVGINNLKSIIKNNNFSCISEFIKKNIF